jgi:EH domain-containing protein 1
VCPGAYPLLVGKFFSFQAEFDAFFAASGPAPRPGGGGVVLVLSPSQVRDALLPTGLPRESLRGVWELSDIDQDGALDADEFAVAMFLCRAALAGDPLPPALPINVIPPSKRNQF